MKAQLVSTGIALPKKFLSSSEIDKQYKQPDGWLYSICGVKTRPKISSNETQEGLGIEAAKRALASSHINPAKLDLILFAAAVGRQPIPATAALIKDGLDLASHPCPAYDVNSTCLSSLTAMDVANMYIQTGRGETVLIVSSEISTRALPWETDPATAGLFGDGAAALILAKPDAGQNAHIALEVQHHKMETWSEGYDFCALPAGGTRYDFHSQPEVFLENSFFQMNGHALFKLTHKRLPIFIKALAQQSGWTLDEIDLVIPHQASPLALEHMIRKCGFHKDKVVNTVEHTGNLVAASLPMTLHTAKTSGRISKGDKILLVGTSAGVSIAGTSLIAL